MSEFAIPADIKKQLDEVQAKQAIAKHKEKVKAEKKKEEEELFPDIEVTEEDMLKFWDTLLERVPYMETFKVRNLAFKLKTRSSKEIGEVFEHMDKSVFVLDASKDRLHLHLMLACSLVEFGDDDLSKKTLEEKVKYIETFPSPLARLVLNRLDYFDCKVLKMTEMLKSENF